ncbi:MAG: hypothetical protein LAT81_03470 [Oceanicaulis sp.]|nr:hypothetical protein [Oceanicaulis sp.]
MTPIRLHLMLGLAWLVAGMLLGEHMGRTGDHGQMPTHAHIMLVGGVLPVLWALVYRTFALGQGIFAWLQTGLHHIGAMIMIVGLYLLYGPMAGDEALGPGLGVSSMLVIAATVLMLVLAARARTSAPAPD